MLSVQRGFSDSGPVRRNSPQTARLEVVAHAQGVEPARSRQGPPGAQASGRSRRESLHEAFAAARAENRALAERFEAAKARFEAIADWIETRRPQLEVLRESGVARMQARLESLPLIEQAKGIVMAEQRCGPEEAFDLLRRAARRANVRVHVLAAQIVAHVDSPTAKASAQPTPAHRDRARSSGARN